MDPQEFLHAVFVDQLPWVLGGGIGSLVAFVWALVRGKRPDDTVLWPVVISIFIACGLAWQKEHEEKVAAVEKVKRDTPAFSSTMDNIVVSNTENGVEMFVQMTVVNQGAPSVVRDFRLKYTPPGHREEVGLPPRNIPDEIPASDEASRRLIETYNITPKTALDTKSSVPIKRGAMARGWLRFLIPTISAEQVRGMPLKMELTDFRGDTSFAAVTVGDEVPPPAPGQSLQFYCPGLERE